MSGRSGGVLQPGGHQDGEAGVGNALFLIGAIGATCGAIAKIRAYHGAFHG